MQCDPGHTDQQLHPVPKAELDLGHGSPVKYYRHFLAKQNNSKTYSSKEQMAQWFFFVKSAFYVRAWCPGHNFINRPCMDSKGRRASDSGERSGRRFQKLCFTTQQAHCLPRPRVPDGVWDQAPSEALDAPFSGGSASALGGWGGWRCSHPAPHGPEQALWQGLAQERLPHRLSSAFLSLESALSVKVLFFRMPWN